MYMCDSVDTHCNTLVMDDEEEKRMLDTCQHKYVL